MFTQKKSYYKVLQTLFLISIIFASAYAIIYINVLNQNIPLVQASSGKMKVRLEISVYDYEGNLKDRVIKDDDMILSNFIEFLTAFFTDTYPTAVEVDLQDISDTQRTFIIHQSGGSNANTFTDSESDTEDKGGFIGIGTDATAPTRADVDLGTQQEGLTQNDANYPAYSNVSGIFVSQTTIASTGTYNVVEAGYYVNWVDELGTVRTIMLMHDVFNPVGVIPTDDIVVSYSLIFDGVEFNQNFGIWFETLLGTYPDGDLIQASFYRTTGVVAYIAVYLDASSGWFGQYDTDQDINANIYFRISTSDTTPTRTTYQLTGLVESYYKPNPVPVCTDTDMTVETAITVSANRSINASGLYVYAPDSGITYWEFLMIHATFSTVEVEVGTAFNVIDLITFT